MPKFLNIKGDSIVAPRGFPKCERSRNTQVKLSNMEKDLEADGINRRPGRLAGVRWPAT